MLFIRRWFKGDLKSLTVRVSLLLIGGAPFFFSTTPCVAWSEAEIKAALEAAFSRTYQPRGTDSKAEVQPERLKFRRQVFEREVLLDASRFLQSGRGDPSKPGLPQVAIRELRDYLRWTAREGAPEVVLLHLKVDPQCSGCVEVQKGLKESAFKFWRSRGMDVAEVSRSQLGTKSVASDGLPLLREVGQKQGKRIVTWVELRRGEIDEAHPDDEKYRVRLALVAKPPHPELSSDQSTEFIYDENLEVDSITGVEGAYARLWIDGLTRLGHDVDLKAWGSIASARPDAPPSPGQIPSTEGSTSAATNPSSSSAVQGGAGQINGHPHLRIPGVTFELKGKWGAIRWAQFRDLLAEQLAEFGRVEEVSFAQGKIVLRLRTDRSFAEVEAALGGIAEKAGSPSPKFGMIASENRIEVTL